MPPRPSRAIRRRRTESGRRPKTLRRPFCRAARAATPLPQRAERTRQATMDWRNSWLYYTKTAETLHKKGYRQNFSGASAKFTVVLSDDRKQLLENNVVYTCCSGCFQISMGEKHRCAQFLATCRNSAFTHKLIPTNYQTPATNQAKRRAGLSGRRSRGTGRGLPWTFRCARGGSRLSLSLLT